MDSLKVGEDVKVVNCTQPQYNGLIGKVIQTEGPDHYIIAALEHGYLKQPVYGNRYRFPREMLKRVKMDWVEVE